MHLSPSAMISRLRTYRFLAAFLVLTLLLSSGLPLVQHACAMASQHAGEQPEPCPPADEAHGHRASQSNAPYHAEQPCLTASASQALHHACCIVQVQHIDETAVKAQQRAGEQLTTAAPRGAVNPVLRRDAPLRLPPRCLTDPPGAASLSLYLLHASFLN